MDRQCPTHASAASSVVPDRSSRASTGAASSQTGTSSATSVYGRKQRAARASSPGSSPRLNSTAWAQLPRKNSNLYAPPTLLLTLLAGLTMDDPTFDSFVTTDDDDMLFDLARPLAARRGLLLARVVAPTLLRDNCWYKLHLAVIDKRTTHLLPPPPFNMTGCMDCSLKGCAIITAKDHAAGDGDLVDHKPPTFQVLLIYNDDSNEYMWACTDALAPSAL